MIAYQDKLSFYHAGTTQQYNLQRIHKHSTVPLWACSQDGDSFRGATYTAEEIAEHFRLGHWWEISFADESPKEPAIVFPFTFETDINNNGVVQYVVSKEGEKPVISSKFGVTTIEEADIRSMLKSGAWRVTSVGGIFEGSLNSTQITNNTSDITIKLNSDAVVTATERLEAFAQAVENVSVSLESLREVFADVQGMLGGGECVEVRTFCCEEG